MPRTPKRAGKSPAHASRFASGVLADNIYRLRNGRRPRLAQQDVAARMRALGHETWRGTTIGEVERGGRSVSVDELFSLGLALETTIDRLLIPDAESEEPGLDVGWHRGPLVPSLARDWMHGDRPRLRIEWEEGDAGVLSFDLKAIEGVTSEASRIVLKLLGSEPSSEPSPAEAIVSHSNLQHESVAQELGLTEFQLQAMKGHGIEEVMQRYQERKRRSGEQERGA